MANIQNMNHAKPAERLQGSLPKIGIRPTIDARLGGVRESLEKQTMKMAQAAKTLLESELHYANGLPVEVVINPTTIGRVSEAAQCSAFFQRENVGASITVTPCWCYGSETIDTTPLIPKAIWGFNGTERPGAVYLAAASAGHNQKGIPVFSIYGRDVQDLNDTSIPDDVRKKLLLFAEAALAAAYIRGKSYLSIGNVSMGIAGCYVTESFYKNYLDMRNEYVDMSEIIRRMNNKIYSEQEYIRAAAWVKENCKEGADPNLPGKQHSPSQKAKSWADSICMALIIRDLMTGNPALAKIGFEEEALGHNAAAAGFQGQRQWTDFMTNGDFAEAVLTSSFDWNGIRQPYMLATENDNLNACTMLLAHLLTGRAQIFADVRTYWSPEAVKRVTGHSLTDAAAQGIIHLINSGPAALDGTGEQQEDNRPVIKQWWNITPEEAGKCLDAALWCPALLEYFHGGGYSTDYTTQGGMPVTMARINMAAGLGPCLQIAEGWTVNLPQSVHDILDKRTNPTWPTTWFVPRLTDNSRFRDVYTVMANWGANHGAIGYGHYGDKLITLASILRIPVYMHNVHEMHHFRPSMWTLFGMDAEGSDFRACQTLGPLYSGS